MMAFLADYEPVEDRLAKFWAEWPNGRVVTHMVTKADGQFIVRAELFRDASDLEPAATGLAWETISEKGVNRTSALENCETSAIGRALANLGYAAKGKRPSREEMEKVVEPVELGPKDWLWDQVQVFKAWSKDEKVEAIRSAMKYLAIEEVSDRDLADRVFAHVTGVYESRPGESQEKLPV